MITEDVLTPEYMSRVARRFTNTDMAQPYKAIADLIEETLRAAEVAQAADRAGKTKTFHDALTVLASAADQLRDFALLYDLARFVVAKKRAAALDRAPDNSAPLTGTDAVNTALRIVNRKPDPDPGV